MKTYPEHEKLHAIAAKSQACGEFLEWIQGHGYTLCRQHEHDKGCYIDETHRHRSVSVCGMSDDYYPERPSVTRLLAKFFEIDEQKLEDEKREMLAELAK